MQVMTTFQFLNSASSITRLELLVAPGRCIFSFRLVPSMHLGNILIIVESQLSGAIFSRTMTRNRGVLHQTGSVT